MEKTGHKLIDKVDMGRFNQTTGLAGEALVRYLLHRWNYDIFEPSNPSTAIDFAIRKKEEWATIQVKTTLDGKGVNLKREKGIRQSIKREKYGYSEHDFDFLFGVKFPEIYIIPFMSIGTKSFVGFKDYKEFSYNLNDSNTYKNPPKLLI